VPARLINIKYITVRAVKVASPVTALHTSPHPLSCPMVKTASLYDNFCKTGNYVIYDVIISVVTVAGICNSVGGGVLFNIPPRWRWRVSVQYAPCTAAVIRVTDRCDDRLVQQRTSRLIALAVLGTKHFATTPLS